MTLDERDKWLEWVPITSIPLKRLRPDKSPFEFASGCLVNYQGRRFILTVAHALGWVCPTGRGGPGNSDSVLSGSLASPTPPKGGEPEERGEEETETQSRGGIQGSGGLRRVQGRQDAGGVGDTIWRASHPDHGMEAATAGTGIRGVWRHEAHVGRAGSQSPPREDRAAGARE